MNTKTITILVVGVIVLLILMYFNSSATLDMFEKFGVYALGAAAGYVIMQGAQKVAGV